LDTTSGKIGHFVQTEPSPLDTTSGKIGHFVQTEPSLLDKMEEKLESFIELKKDEQEVNLMPPLTWAYVGDCVYELYIRTKLVNETKLKPHQLHIKSIQYVKAKSQAEILKNIHEELSEKEKEIVRRGRNAENHHLPKNANVQDYMYATAFEALIGYLYLTKQNDRLKEILNKIA